LFGLPPDNCTMVVFGGTGDLTHRKLVPALYNLHLSGQLPEDFSLVGVGRKLKENAQYRAELATSVEDFSAATYDDQSWADFAAKLYYYAGDLHDAESYPGLKDALKTCACDSGNDGNYLFYLAVAPQLFAPIAGNLARFGLSHAEKGWRRIMIEKPFGYDLVSAGELNKALVTAFDEKNIYRIDHYLGKEMLQNILVIRFANEVFEPLWNNHFIDNIQFNALESEGIGQRGRYYDQAGALRDMVQSHLLQMMAITAMEPPAENCAPAIRLEKLRLLNSVQLWPDGEPGDNLAFGQYKGFRDEKDVASDSQTETFAAVRLAVNNARWQGVPFYLRSGKKLQDKQAKIVVQFKKPPGLFARERLANPSGDRGELLNLLTLKVQPSEGVAFQFNIKKPGTTAEIAPVEMDFCQPCAFMINSPEAYERLLADAMIGDTTRFTSWDEVEKAWALTDKIYAEYKRSGQMVNDYAPGETGPPAAEEMLSRHGHRWWN
jgi:glucose-6-phosphate 1-dehydrogenase